MATKFSTGTKSKRPTNQAKALKPKTHKTRKRMMPREATCQASKMSLEKVEAKADSHAVARGR